MRIILGAVFTLPPYCPGMIWNRLQYALGFRSLGHDVYVVEQVEPDWCVDAAGDPCRLHDSINRRWFDAVMVEFGFTGRACQVYRNGEDVAGMSLQALAATCREADLLLNIAGHVRADVVLGNVRRRAYLDQDPVYTQLWRAEYGHSLNLDAHDVFLTVGLNIGTAHSQIPTAGVNWRHTLPPVVLNGRAAADSSGAGRFSTVASWTSFGDICYRGEWYRSKEAEFKRYAALPARVDQEFEVALRRHDDADDDVRLLREHGWIVTPSSRFTDLASYRAHIAGARAEIGIAKHAYVHGRSGWFSDRTADYLAHGKPALVQSTGFERYLPTGEGLLTFASMAEAVEGVQRINHDYGRHCRGARAFAEAYLDARKVLPRLLADCGVA